MSLFEQKKYSALPFPFPENSTRTKIQCHGRSSSVMTRNSIITPSTVASKKPIKNDLISYLGVKNAKQKVLDFEQAASNMQKKVDEMRTQIKLSIVHASNLHSDLTERMIPEWQSRIMERIQKMERKVKTIKLVDEQRTQQLENQCKQMNQKSQQLNQLMEVLSQRVDDLEDSMGIYSGKQKHRF